MPKWWSLAFVIKGLNTNRLLHNCHKDLIFAKINS